MQENTAGFGEGRRRLDHGSEFCTCCESQKSSGRLIVIPVRCSVLVRGRENGSRSIGPFSDAQAQFGDDITDEVSAGLARDEVSKQRSSSTAYAVAEGQDESRRCKQ